MTEPNRDAPHSPLPSNPAPHSPLLAPPSIPANPANPANTASPANPTPWQPDPSVRHPGIFTRDAAIPSTIPGASFIESLRFLVPKVFGIDWYVRRRGDDAATIWSKRPIDISFEVAIRRPVARGEDYVTTVDHVVQQPDVAAALERLLGDHPGRVSELTSLLVGHVRQPVPENPFQPALLHVGIANRWPVHPSAAEEHRLAEFVVWNIQILLWLRAQARRQIHLLLTAPRPAEAASRLPRFTAAQNHGGNEHGEFTPADPQSPQNSPLPANTASTANPLLAPRSSLLDPCPPLPSLPASQRPSPPTPSRLEKGWESSPWPLGGNPFGDPITWVGLCSSAIFQPLAFDPGYWLEFWTSHCDGANGGVSLIEAVRRALPIHLDAAWRIEYRGSSHHFLRHDKHPWIFEISERKFTGFRPEDAPSPFSIRSPGGPYCPTGTAYEVRLISNSLEQASAVAREVCDRRSGTCDNAASFFRDRSPDSVRWGIIAELGPFIPRAPAHPQRHARPGFDVSGWWDGDPLRRLPFQTLRVIWALKILHASCLRHGPTAISDEWRR